MPESIEFEDGEEEDVLDSIRNGALSDSEDARLVQEALSRIVLGFRAKGIEAGGFIWFGDDSVGITNASQFEHLGRLTDYQTRLIFNTRLK